MIFNVKKNNDLIYTLIAFFAIFSFNIPIFQHSFLLFGCLLFCVAAVNEKYSSLTFSRLFLAYIIVVILLSIVVMFGFVLHGEFQQQLYFKQIVLFLIFLIIATVYLFYFRKLDALSFLRVIIFAYVLQSLIQIVALNSELFRHFVQLTYTEHNLLISKSYGYLRGVSLYSDPYFSLAVSYAFGFLMYFHYVAMKKYKNIKFKDVVTFFLIFIGSLFTGRTALFGLLFGLCYFFLQRKRASIMFMKSFIYMLIFISIIYLLLPSDSKAFIEHQILHRAFSFVYNYFEKGTVHTASTEHLMSMLSVNIKDFTMAFGDGKFTNSVGGYYMSNDSGYFRNIFYFGVFGSFFVYSLFIIYCLLPFVYYNYDGRYMLLSVFFMIMMFFIHIKGMTIFSNKGIYCIWSIYAVIYFNDYGIKRNRTKHKINDS